MIGSSYLHSKMNEKAQLLLKELNQITPLNLMRLTTASRGSSWLLLCRFGLIIRIKLHDICYFHTYTTAALNLLMNIHELTETEASYLLFAIKKALRDRPGLTPGMEQFFDSTYDSLSKKITRCRNGGSQAEVRDKFAKVRPTWHDVALGKVSGDPPANS